MSFDIQEYSMEHFLLEYPKYRELSATEFIAMYNTWLEHIATELAADTYCNLQKSGYYD